MFEWIYKLFVPTAHPDATQSLVVIMMAISAGVLLGRFRIGKVSLGVAGVMFVGLFLGHLGYSIEAHILQFIRDLGLILFVYAIGIQVGPSFFSSFKKEGLRLNLLAVATVLLGGVIAYLIFIFSDLKIENIVGMMSGSVTNTPGLGAAKSTLQEISSINPGRKFSDPAIAYAITYPMGVLGIITMIILAKYLLKIDIPKEIETFHDIQSHEHVNIVHQKCRITNQALEGKSIYQVFKDFNIENIIISRLKHSGSKVVFSPTLDTKLLDRDVLMVVGTQEDVDVFIAIAGKVSTDLLIESEEDVTKRKLYVTRKSAAHKTLAELDLYNKFDLKVTRVRRSGMELLAYPLLELFYGDQLTIVGNKSALKEAEKIIGNSEKRLLEPDFLSLFGGLIIGIIIGSVPIMVPSLPVPIKLGFAAGPLMAALLISRYGGIGILHSYINNGAIHFMKDLGICLFFAAVGVHAGADFYDNFIHYNGWMWISYGALITFIPLIFLVVVGRFVLKLNFVQLVGLMSGTYTDPAALAFGTSYLNSDIPTQSYATVYPLVTIFRIFVAQLLILLLV